MTAVPARAPIALVQAYFAAEKSGPDAILDLLTPDVVIDVPASLPYGGEHGGHDGFTRAATAFGEAWSEIDSSDFNYTTSADGLSVVAISRMRATARRTGRAVDSRVAETFAIRGGQIAHIRPFYFDTAALLAALEEPRA